MPNHYLKGCLKAEIILSMKRETFFYKIERAIPSWI